MKCPHDNVKKLVATEATREFALTSRMLNPDHLRLISSAVLAFGLMMVGTVVLADEFAPRRRGCL